MSLWQSYRSLAPRSRLFLGLGLIAWSGVGLFITGQAEQRFGMVPTEKDHERLAEVLPKVRVVEREE